jgi:hypothetical protein
VYSGDGNFNGATSGVLTQLVQDFSIGFNTSTVTALPGGSAVFTLTAAPLNGSTFPSPITLSISGLPAGATYSFQPPTLAAGQGSATVTLTVNIPQSVASASPLSQQPGPQVAGDHHDNQSGGMFSKLAPLSLAMILLPFAGRLRRSGKRLSRKVSVLLLLAAGIAAVGSLSACVSGSGYFAQQQQTYTVNVTGTAGALSHSTTATLTVE